MVDRVVGVPERVHVHPRAGRVLPETFLGLRLRVRAELPLRVSIMISVQDNGRLKTLAERVGIRALPCDGAVTPEIHPSVSIVPARRTQARSGWGRIVVDLPGGICDGMVLADAPGAISLATDPARKWPRNGTVAPHLLGNPAYAQHCKRSAHVHAESGFSR